MDTTERENTKEKNIRYIPEENNNNGRQEMTTDRNVTFVMSHMTSRKKEIRLSPIILLSK